MKSSIVLLLLLCTLFISCEENKDLSWNALMTNYLQFIVFYYVIFLTLEGIVEFNDKNKTQWKDSKH